MKEEWRFDVDVDHVYTDSASRLEASELPPSERQRRVGRMLIRSPAFTEAQQAIKTFHLPVDGGHHDSGKVCGILGPARVGKSWAIERYTRHLGLINNGEAIIPRAVYVNAAKNWTSTVFAQDIHVRSMLPSSPRGTAAHILDIVASEIAQHGTELVVIDDAQFLLQATDRKTRSDVEGFLIKVAERKTCNVILVGTAGIREAVKIVDHIHGRGLFPVVTIAPYQWRLDEALGGFGDLLDEIDDRLPFRRPSNLSEPNTAAHLYRVSGGLIGAVKVYVEEASAVAMNQNADHVTVDHLHRVAQRHREVNDPYDPFRSAIDQTDPLGERRAADRDALPKPEEEPKLTKKRGRKPR